ncbi:MAG TPA: response regulator transcription factor [Steroidobacteraceae bacterium]|nr:response regulator transcription factor [Steroidobacteraceae bacterium]
MKLLIVDDHPLFRDGLAALLRQASADTAVMQASTTEEALQLVDEQIFDAMFMDLVMPGLCGEPAIREFARRHPDLPIIVLSSSEDPGDVRRVLNAGASGYIPKSATAQTVVSALTLVLSGNIYVPPLLVSAATRAAESAASAPRSLSALTDRQVDVLKYLRDGLSNKEISASLGIAEKTVKVHIAAIFKTLNVVNRTQAARFLHEAPDSPRDGP